MNCWFCNNEILCWLCNTGTNLTKTDIGDHNCKSCGVQISIYKEEEMGKLGDLARAKSPFIKLEIGQSTPPIVYKAWKEITNSFNQESFRYTFEQETDTGIVAKTLDVGSTSFAIQMDTIPFGSKVIITREQKVDATGNIVDDKSIYTVALA